MNLIGASLDKVLQTKYDFKISYEDYNTNITRLTNQLWKLIPMREKEEDWIKQLDTVIIEIAGLNALIGAQAPLFVQLLSKLEGLRIQCDIEFETYRKTVFETINLIQRLKK